MGCAPWSRGPQGGIEYSITQLSAPRSGPMAHTMGPPRPEWGSGALRLPVKSNRPPRAEDRPGDRGERAPSKRRGKGHVVVGGMARETGAPAPEAQGAIARHLEDAHGLSDFDLESDVAFGDNVPADPAVAYLAGANGDCPGFQCARCPHREFVGKPDYENPRRQALLRHTHREELAGLLRGVPPEDQSRVIANWESGRIGRDRARESRRRRQMATRPASRPSVAARRERCQTFLLEHYEQHGRLEDAIAALVELATSDRQRHLEIVGRPQPMAPSTYHAYWNDIPLEVREDVKQEARRRESAPRGGAPGRARGQEEIQPLGIPPARPAPPQAWVCGSPGPINAARPDPCPPGRPGWPAPSAGRSARPRCRRERGAR